MSFTFNQLSKPIAEAIESLGFESPTEIQDKAIPILLNSDRDFVGQAQTGTGKTAAFVLPLLERIDPDKKGLQAVILSPTRELANQIDQQVQLFAKNLRIESTVVCGGMSYRKQIDGLKTSQLVIATPGRAIDLLNRGSLRLGQANVLVIDEADEMLNMGFIEDVELIMESMSEESVRWLFSATMPRPIVKLVEQKLDEPKIVSVKKKTLSNANVTQSFIPLQRKDYFKAIRSLVVSDSEFYGIVFCETREEAKNLSERIAGLGQPVVALHGDLNQRQRDLAMDQFKRRAATIMVCTDVAARGLDITELTHVINMGLPRNIDSYVHRIGRTGRAGKTGLAISLVSPGERRRLRMIEQHVNQKISPYKIPEKGQIKENIVRRELEKMEGLKNSLIEKRDEFRIDESFNEYKEFFEGLSKDEITKLLFSFQFNGQLRTVEESLKNLDMALKNGGPSYDRSERGDRRERRGGRPRGGARRGGIRRADGRDGDGRRRDGRDSDGRRRDGRDSDGRRRDGRRGEGYRGGERRSDSSRGGSREGTRGTNRRSRY